MTATVITTYGTAQVRVCLISPPKEDASTEAPNIWKGLNSKWLIQTRQRSCDQVVCKAWVSSPEKGIANRYLKTKIRHTVGIGGAAASDA